MRSVEERRSNLRTLLPPPRGLTGDALSGSAKQQLHARAHALGRWFTAPRAHRHRSMAILCAAFASRRRATYRCMRLAPGCLLSARATDACCYIAVVLPHCFVALHFGSACWLDSGGSNTPHATTPKHLPDGCARFAQNSLRGTSRPALRRVRKRDGGAWRGRRKRAQWRSDWQHGCTGAQHAHQLLTAGHALPGCTDKVTLVQFGYETILYWALWTWCCGANNCHSSRT